MHSFCLQAATKVQPFRSRRYDRMVKAEFKMVLSYKKQPFLQYKLYNNFFVLNSYSNSVILPNCITLTNNERVLIGSTIRTI